VDDDDCVFVLCWPTNLYSRRSPVAGSRAAPCSRCDVAVWVAPSSDLRAWRVEPVCVLCATPDEIAVALGGEVSDEQRDEIRAGVAEVQQRVRDAARWLRGLS